MGLQSCQPSQLVIAQEMDSNVNSASILSEVALHIVSSIAFLDCTLHIPPASGEQYDGARFVFRRYSALYIAYLSCSRTTRDRGSIPYHEQHGARPYFMHFCSVLRACSSGISSSLRVVRSCLGEPEPKFVFLRPLLIRACQILHVSNIAFLAFNLGCAYSKTTGILIGFRFLGRIHWASIA